ncbi:unnamed protein product [Musa hybrid cultivar]
METFGAPTVSVVLLALLSILTNPLAAFGRQTPNHDTHQRRTYIIQLRKPAASLDEQNLNIWYESFLPESDGSSMRLLHSYSEVFSGFAAELTEEEVKNMEKKEGFLRAHPDRVVPLLTTHTPAFLGLKQNQGLWKASNLGKGVIIGVLDTGLTPSHSSFDDEGMPPPPAKWKGSCSFESGCNNKLIGAKDMISGGSSSSPTDEEGHGTHTASTAAGNFARNASAFGLGGGTAAGMAPHAHLAIYKVCSSQGCSLADVLSGIDAGVKDGADVLSLSLGGTSLSLAEDPLAIGSFGATEKGVFVSCAGGNSGPSQSSVSNEAPWILTVAASTTDRSFRASIELGDGHSVNGESLDQLEALSETSLPLYFSQDSPDCGSISGDASGKVVVCKAGQSPADLATRVKDSGGVALIYITDASQGSTKLVRRVEFPAAFVSDKDGASIISYATSKSNPTASISFGGAVLGASAPSVAFFSSRGPSLACPSIIKPDISGPGVNILAAWMDSEGTGESNYNIISGTSMATPHLSGVAALIKSVHPKWSPAAIKSAIITTSDDKIASGKPIRDQQEEPASFFAMGAGHVNPSKAVDPGLIYDLNTDDYIAYICGKFGDAGASVIVRDRSVNCDNVKNITEANLNYPSIFVALQSGSSVTVKRTVTNVGAASSSYKVQVNVPKSVSVTVTPQTLKFSEVKEKKSFTVTVKLTGSSSSVEGNLKWISDKHVVRSPIVVSSS